MTIEEFIYKVGYQRERFELMRWVFLGYEIERVDGKVWKMDLSNIKKFFEKQGKEVNFSPKMIRYMSYVLGYQNSPHLYQDFEGFKELNKI